MYNRSSTTQRPEASCAHAPTLYTPSLLTRVYFNRRDDPRRTAACRNNLSGLRLPPAAPSSIWSDTNQTAVRSAGCLRATETFQPPAKLDWGCERMFRLMQRHRPWPGQRKPAVCLLVFHLSSLCGNLSADAQALYQSLGDGVQ